MNKIITISRTYGSGGNQVGRLLAEKLGIPFYDREIIEKAAEDSGLAIESFEDAGSKAGNKFLYRLYIGATTPMATTDNSIYIKNSPTSSVEDLVFEAQSKIIKEYAKEGPCVIVGRSADYVLRDNPNVVSVFLWADDKYRIDRIVNLQQMYDKKAEETIRNIDKRRKNYYNYHTSRVWGDATHYEMTLRTDLVGLKNTAEVIKNYVESIDK